MQTGTWRNELAGKATVDKDKDTHKSDIAHTGRKDVGALEKAVMKAVTTIGAKYYLGKPDLLEFLRMKFPDYRSALTAIGNELFFRLNSRRGYRLTSANIEVTSKCNLRCAMCPIEEMERPSGSMEWDLYREIIDRNPDILSWQLYQWGESLLHPEITRMIRYAADKGKRTFLTTNGFPLKGPLMGEILKSGLERLTFSVDGKDSTYEKIRGRRYDDVQSVIHRFLEENRRMGSPVSVDVSMVVSEDTEAEMEIFRREWEKKVSRVQLIPLLIEKRRTRRCRELWRGATVVLWNGLVTICCVDYNGEAVIGDASILPLAEIWNGEKIIEWRKRQIDRSFQGICRNCGEYSSPGASKRFE